MKVFSGARFCISCKMPLSVATMKVEASDSMLYLSKAAVLPTLSANFTTAPRHSGCTRTLASGYCFFKATIFSTENFSCT